MEYTLLEDKKIIFDLSFIHFFRILYVPTKFVLKTLSGFLSEASTAGSAQQSTTRLNLGREITSLKFSILILKFFILNFESLLLFNGEPLRERLSKL